MTLATYFLPSSQLSEWLTSRDQLIEFFVKSETSRTDTMIAAGHEKFSYRLNTRNPVAYEEQNGLKDFMMALHDFGWQSSPPYLEATRGLSRITLGAGGQISFHGSAHKTLHEVASEIDQHITEICDIGERLRIGFLGLGYHPTSRPDNLNSLAGDLLQNLQVYQKNNFPLDADLACHGASNWAHFNYTSEDDWRKKFRVALALEPIATALFAASPIQNSHTQGWVSTRQQIRSKADQGQKNNFNFMFKENFSYGDCIDAALDAPMRFIVRDDTIIDYRHCTFREFLKLSINSSSNNRPILHDWFLHLKTIYANTNTWTTLRLLAADASSTEMALALPSFWTGLFYDDASLASAWTMVESWTAEDHWRLRDETPYHGLRSQIRGQPLLAFAENVMTLAKQGLRRRAYRLHGGADEARYLETLFNILDSGQSISDQILMRQEHYKDFTMDALFETYRIRPPINTNASP